MSGKIDQHTNTPIVSVIVPCYNYANYLTEALNSVMNQTFIDWECIIIDDGSTDNSKKIANEFVSKDNRFSYHCQDNSGLSVARNKGLGLAKGKFIQFLDADDVLASKKFEVQVRLFNKYPKADVLYCDYELMSEDGKEKWNNKKTNWIEIKGDPFRCFLNKWEKGFSIPIHCNLFRSKCFNTIKFDEKLPTHEDIDLQLRLSSSGTVYEYVDEVLVYYRVHNASMARNYTRMHLGYLMALLNALRIENIGFANKLRIIHRYNQEYRNAWFSVVKRRKMNIWKVLFLKGALLINIEATLVLTIYVLFRLLQMF
ncbi:MAG: glycosyltransferase [Bacteroidia bacterium]